MGLLQGDWIPHPNSLMFNAFPPFWALKAFWFTRKVSYLSNQLQILMQLSPRRLVNSSCSGTSPSLPKATLMPLDLANTLASNSTERPTETLPRGPHWLTVQRFITEIFKKRVSETVLQSIHVLCLALLASHHKCRLSLYMLFHNH